MAHTVTWGAAFDATPGGSDDVKDGDDRIRELKTAVSERMALEHYFTKAGTNNWQGVHTPPFAIEAGATRTLAITDEIVCCSTTCTVTVPAYTSFPTGKRFVIKRTGAGTVTIVRSGSDTFDGSTSLSIDNIYEWYELICTGTATWYIVGKSYGATTIPFALWTNFSPASGWAISSSGTDQTAYIKDHLGLVRLTGRVQTGTGATLIYTMPSADLYPVRRVYFLGHCYTTPSGYIYIDTNGTVVMSGGGSTEIVTLDGLVWPATT